MDQVEVVLGVDTHLDVHVGVVIDAVGRVMGTISIETTTAGYERLLTWARSFGRLSRAGIEGADSYGAGLTRFLEASGVAIVEINRPNRSVDVPVARATRPMSRALRAVLADDATGIPKAKSGMVEALRTLGVARRSAVKAKTQAINQLRALLVSAPSFIRDALLKVKPEHCVAACAALPDDDKNPVLVSLRTTLRLLARRWNALHDELRELDKRLTRLTRLAAPRLLAHFGVGPQTAATLLVTAGDNPTRLRNESALAALCGVSRLQASSGKTSRHRLNRGGQRQANNALWAIAMVRMRSDARTRDYVVRRAKEGVSKKEIHRCLKRYIARELYPLILADLADSAGSG